MTWRYRLYSSASCAYDMMNQKGDKCFCCANLNCFRIDLSVQSLCWAGEFLEESMEFCSWITEIKCLSLSWVRNEIKRVFLTSNFKSGIFPAQNYWMGVVTFQS